MGFEIGHEEAQSMKNAAIISLKFSPGLYQHAIAYAEAFRFLGFQPILFLNKKYKFMAKQNEFIHIWSARHIRSTNYSICVFINIHPKNLSISRELIKSNTKIAYLYHEPWENIRNYLREGYIQTCKAIIANLFSLLMLRKANIVILPSLYALSNYERRDVKWNENYIVIPLLYSDELKGEINLKERPYFSYIGHAVKGHGFDLFIRCIKYITKIDEEIKFSVATRNNLSRLIRKDESLRYLINKNKLIFSHGRPLSDQEINEYYEKSFSIFNVYRRSTQSGVLAKAFMFGVPVIANNIASFPEYIRDGVNGYLINEYDEKIIYDKIKKIKLNFSSFCKEARASYEENFYWKNKIELVQKLC